MQPQRTHAQGNQPEGTSPPQTTKSSAGRREKAARPSRSVATATPRSPTWAPHSAQSYQFNPRSRSTGWKRIAPCTPW
eukprot:1165899-Pyramimonas_sp.AAC.1